MLLYISIFILLIFLLEKKREYFENLDVYMKQTNYGLWSLSKDYDNVSNITDSFIISFSPNITKKN